MSLVLLMAYVLLLMIEDSWLRGLVGVPEKFPYHRGEKAALRS